MVYVYAKQSELNKYIGRELSLDEIESILVDMGMDIKGKSGDDDPELKIEITAEKMDLVSCVGVARAIKFYGGFAKDIPKYHIEKSGLKLLVKKSASESRPKCVCAVLRNVPMTDELLDEMIKVQEKIHDSFGRGRKKGAIGIYPLSEISFPITYGAENPQDIIFRPLEFDREVNGHEILELHDTGKKYAHLLKDFKTYPVFRDCNGKILSMPPIINSHDTGRVDSFHSDLFIECSGFNINHLDNILKVLVTTFIEMGAKAQSIEVVYEENSEIYELNLDNFEDEFSLDFANKLIGTQIKANEIEKYLNRMMYKLVGIEGDRVKVEVPCFRSDVWHDVDIIDDIARGYGYNNIVPTFPNISSIGEELKISKFKESFSNALVSLGFLETYTYMLTSTQTQFKKMERTEDGIDFIRLIDSADQGLNMIRTQILPETFETLHINRKNKYPQKIFENGFTIQVDETKDTLARNEAHLCVAIADTKANYTQIKGILDTLLKLHEIDFEIKKSSEEFLIEGRRADVFVKGKNVGFIGEVHPRILTNFGLLVPISVFELNLEKIFEILN